MGRSKSLIEGRVYRAEQMMKFNIYKDGVQKAKPQANADTAQAEPATEEEVKDDRHKLQAPENSR